MFTIPTNFSFFVSSWQFCGIKGKSLRKRSIGFHEEGIMAVVPGKLNFPLLGRSVLNKLKS